ncbi:MAG: hypothetical protein AAFQ71_11455 [Planctomycetota bacterium]
MPDELKFTAKVDLQAADGEKPPRFEMVAYTGGPMAGFSRNPLFVDLSGLEASKDQIPILGEHDRTVRLGFGTVENDGGRLTVRGELVGSGEDAQAMIADARNGFPFEASIGASVGQMRRIKAGESETLNGREIKGPAEVVAGATLREVSFVVNGADRDTTARIAASAKRNGVQAMSEGEKLAAKLGLKWDDLTETQQTNLEAQAGGVATDDEIEAEMVTHRKLRAKESRRVSTIEDLTEDHKEIRATAIEEGWTVQKTELAVLRAERPKAGQFGSARENTRAESKGRNLDTGAIEVGVLLATGYDESKLEKEGYTDQQLEAGRAMSPRMGLKNLILACGQADGHYVDTFTDEGDLLNAAASFTSLASVTDNVMEKQALATYRRYPITALQFARVLSVPDFKQASIYRLRGAGEWRPVPEGGELKQAEVADDKYTNQAETYGLTNTIDRKKLINDDLGILSDWPQEIGRTAAHFLNSTWVQRVIANTGSHFASGNGNVATSAALGLAGLAAAVKAMRNQQAGPRAKAASQQSIAIEPRKVLVPSSLEATALGLFNSERLITGSDTTTTDSNIYRGRFTPYVEPRLELETGGSATTWYLGADPADAAAYSIAFLRGRQQPTIERVTETGKVLGLMFRAWFDFGINEMDPKGMVRATA